MNRPNFPLVIKPNTSFPYNPVVQPHTLLFKYYYKVEFHCPGTRLMLAGKDTGRSWILGTCVKHHPVHNYNSADILCKGPKTFLVYQHEKLCARHANLFRFYFPLKYDKRLDIFSLCFQAQRSIALFTFHTLRSTYFSFREEEISLDSLQMDSGIYETNHDPITAQVYNKTNQRIQINKLFNSPPDSDAFVPNDDQYSLVPTFLTPPEDFYYPDFKKLVKRYINVVPQWKVIHDNNWKNVEKEIRKCIRIIRQPIKIWTGIFDTVKIPFFVNDYQGFRSIYLHRGANETSTFPAPYIFFKLLYSLVQKTAIALVVINYPFSNKRIPFCEDVSQEAGWMVNLEKKNVTLGHAFACEYYAFRQFVPYLPKLQVTELLRCNQKYKFE